MLDSRIILFSGRVIDPLCPDPDMIDIRDIAHALALQCRWSGHVSEFYSVGEHSVRVARLFDDRQRALWALLHDSPETYIMDLASPLKADPDFGSRYRRAERRLMAVIARRFGLSMPLPSEVHRADQTLLATEYRDLMPSAKTLEAWFDVEPLKEVIRPWGPRKAERIFLERYEELR